MHRPERGEKKMSPPPGTGVAEEAAVCFFVRFLWHQSGFYTKGESCEKELFLLEKKVPVLEAAICKGKKRFNVDINPLNYTSV